jgi:hypothetical protein
VLEDDAVTGADIAILHETEKDCLLFHSGVESLKNASNTTYTYRTIDQQVTIANSGLLTKSIAGNPNEFYPYIGTLTDDQERDIYLIPRTNIIAQSNIPGTATIATSDKLLVGSGTSFISDLRVGDWIQVWSNSTVHTLNRVVTIANNTSATLAHGVWRIADDGRPLVVWHAKFLESDDWVTGEYFDWTRFDTLKSKTISSTTRSMRERELSTFCMVPHCSRNAAFCQSFKAFVFAPTC